MPCSLAEDLKVHKAGPDRVGVAVDTVGQVSSLREGVTCACSVPGAACVKSSYEFLGATHSAPGRLESYPKQATADYRPQQVCDGKRLVLSTLLGLIRGAPCCSRLASAVPSLLTLASHAPCRMGSKSPGNTSQPPAFFSKLTESNSAMVKSKKQEINKKLNTHNRNEPEYSKRGARAGAGTRRELTF